MLDGDLQDYYLPVNTIGEDWDFIKSSYFKLLDSGKFKMESEDDVLSFVEEWNDLLQEFRWNRKNNIISQAMSKCLMEEDCDIANESSIDDFLYYVKKRIMNELKTN